MAIFMRQAVSNEQDEALEREAKQLEIIYRLRAALYRIANKSQHLTADQIREHARAQYADILAEMKGDKNK